MTYCNWIYYLLPSRVEDCFNKHHIKARSSLKNPLEGYLFGEPEDLPLFALKVVAARCMLHNLCQFTDDILEEDHFQDEDEENMDLDLEKTGNNIWARLAAQLSAPEELPACLQYCD